MTHLYLASISKKLAATAVLSFAAISSASALTLDTFIDSANLGNSGDQTELDAFQTASSVTLTQFDKVDTGGQGGTFAVADTVSGQWVIDVTGPEPDYFLLKFGTGGTGVSDDTYFFRNIGELDQLVFSDSQVNFLTGGCEGNNCNIGRLSHFTLYAGTDDGGPGTGGPGNEVPEPATVALLGLGLLGLAASRRKAKHKNA